MNLTVKDKKSDTFIRWTENERIQHWLLAVSFIILAFTGFWLKYPDVWWVQPFAGIEWLFALRSLLHRLAGALFLVVGVYHVFYLIAIPRGRLLLKAFKPSLKDLKDLRQNIAFNVGLSAKRPAFGHFSYMEKLEYWALIWGALIMGATGLLLWFENFSLTIFPKWILDLLTVIHLYEAWLATLAIVVWHLYFVIFDPDIYPLNTSMVTGQISDTQMRHEHFSEWEALQSSDSPADASNLPEHDGQDPSLAPAKERRGQENQPPSGKKKTDDT